MLTVEVPGREWLDEKTNMFIGFETTKLLLEHSLLSLSKWESKWKKPFFDSANERTWEESVDYIRAMTINKGVPPMVYYGITQDLHRQISEYINDPMTATTVTKHGKNKRPSPKREIITSEVIYSWMVAHGIPFECEKWHLNRLMKLIEVCDINGQPKQKMNAKDIMRQNASLNAARRASRKSKG